MSEIQSCVTVSDRALHAIASLISEEDKKRPPVFLDLRNIYNDVNLEF